jgi:4-amino-4-deoxy-L-arabinose transferase-like glycosyltransferase
VGALITFALHVATSFRYGYQRDEMYFIACGRQLAWGYVDQPPLIALVADASIRLFGDSLTAIRLLPGVAAGLLVALCGWLSIRLGGGIFAAGLSMLAIGLAPFDFAVGNLLTMNAFEPLFWTAAATLLMLQLERPQSWNWPLLGAVFGLGFLNKWSMLAFAIALAAGIALCGSRRILATRGCALAVLIAAALAAPNLWWQALNGWPQIELLHNAAAIKDESGNPLAFLLLQALIMGPGAVPLWIAGLVALGRRFPGIAWSYGVLLVLYLALGAKIYYMAPIYPLLIAAGTPLLERTALGWGRRAALTGFVALASLAILPAATPILPLPEYLVYQRALDLRPVRMERRDAGLVPQHFADQLGWESLVATAHRSVSHLRPDEVGTAAILTADYGQAAALSFLGKDQLPIAISGHNQYYLWGPHGDHPALIAIGISRETLLRAYRSVEQIDAYENPYVLPYSNHLPVYLCRDARLPLTAFWPQLRRYI